jgi:hypothetical protein
MRRGTALKRVGAVMVAALVFGALAVPQAPALNVGELEVDIAVNTGNWSACGYVRDDLTSAYYTAVLTATGYESTVSRNGVIAEQAMHSGNPAQPCTPGGFDSSIAAVVYTLEWTSVLGTSGSMVKTCFETPPVSSDISIIIDPPPVESSTDNVMAPPDLTASRRVCSIS